MKPTVMDPEGARLAAELILEAVAGEDLDCVGDMAVDAVPIVTAVAMASSGTDRPLPGFLVRKEIKERGTEKQVEGNMLKAAVLIVEDVTTTGGSSMQAIDAFSASNGTVPIVVTIVDRLGRGGQFPGKGNSDDFLLTKDDSRTSEPFSDLHRQHSPARQPRNGGDRPNNPGSRPVSGGALPAWLPVGQLRGLQVAAVCGRRRDVTLFGIRAERRRKSRRVGSRLPLGALGRRRDRLAGGRRLHLPSPA